ncbi:Rieske (2Fe-2S) protein [Prolixibacteraceae bacterium JC049]|nr:Rieske (2Fe-2S) protein [Prolixibacteraceae bacterium JC049]
MKRLNFIKQFALGGSILLTAPVVFSSCSSNDDDMKAPEDDDMDNSGDITIDLSSNAFSALGTVGGFAYKNNIIVIRSAESSYIALSKLCTHSQCTVTYSHANGNLPCPCHGSIFSTSGNVLNGPASTNLKQYSVKKEGNTLTIT